ncbi:MAG: hypothetical protein JRH11_27900 [Deltaproteobacteria bacterium]|nr:hypothetical protein [Deltaproteobacteria bacterium]
MATGGATVDIERGTFRRTGIVALGVLDASTLTAEDIIVEDTRGNTDGTWGRAVHAQAGGSATVDRLRADRVRGMAASSFEGELVLRDMHVAEVIPGPLMEWGGASCNGGRLVLERVRFEQVNFGVNIFDGAEVTVTDLFTHGGGIQVIGGSTLDAERVHIDEPSHFGLSSFEESVVHVEDLVILAPGDPGHGIVAMTQANVHIARFLIQDAPVCGVYVAEEGVLDLRDGDIEGCLIGACVQSDDYDTTRLSDGVSYLDNDTNFDGVGILPVPMPAGVGGGGGPIDMTPMP